MRWKPAAIDDVQSGENDRNILNKKKLSQWWWKKHREPAEFRPLLIVVAVVAGVVVVVAGSTRDGPAAGTIGAAVVLLQRIHLEGEGRKGAKKSGRAVSGVAHRWRGRGRRRSLSLSIAQM